MKDISQKLAALILFITLSACNHGTGLYVSFEDADLGDICVGADCDTSGITAGEAATGSDGVNAQDSTLPSSGSTDLTSVDNTLADDLLVDVDVEIDGEVDPDDFVIDGPENDPFENVETEVQEHAKTCIGYLEWFWNSNNGYEGDPIWYDVIENCEDLTDADGDGLAHFIDPNDESKTEWFIVDPEATTAMYATTNYVQRTYRIIEVRKLQMKNPELNHLQTTAKSMAKNVYGVTDASKMSEPLPYCGGQASDQSKTYLCIVHIVSTPAVELIDQHNKLQLNPTLKAERELKFAPSQPNLVDQPSFLQNNNDDDDEEDEE